ncbi:MAG: ATP-dependent Clp protease proteolytic subunit [Cyanobacteria bacterium HKST-UBA04]|nr:ATP-dependent Clp protease proteolytic subunit [Cyanobacteria bacterium HKST-UBA04]
MTSPKKKSTGDQSAPVIDKSIKNDRAIEIRGPVDLNAVTVAKIQRGLILQDVAKGGEASSLKFFVGPSTANKYRMQDQAALADTFLFVSHPVDAVIKSGMGCDMLRAFLSVTGKRFMLAGACLNMGVITNTAPYGKNKANQVRRQLFNDYVTDLQTLVMIKTGETDRKKVHEDLLSARDYSALQALYYGTKGLIDGILLGRDQVITRPDLDQFLKGKRWNQDRINDFLKNYINVYEIPTRSLASFSKNSIPKGDLSYYQPLNKKDEEGGDKGKKKKKKTESGPQFYKGEKKFRVFPPKYTISKEKPDKRFLITHIPKQFSGLLNDDVIFFNDHFCDETAEQISDALIALDHKKVLQKRASHIKIIENSPGGSVWSGQELRSIIRSLLTPVDVLVYGMAASCGCWLLCSATGNRFATPNSRIMFHEAATEIRSQVPADNFNELHDGLDQATIDFVAIVAEGSGRPFEAVLKDFDHDVWLNPIESLFYGPKGLIDGIVVAHDKVLTRPMVEQYLAKRLGGTKKLAEYVEKKILEKRDPRLGMKWEPEKHDETDPFDNPLKVITEMVASVKLAPLSSLQTFKLSVPVADKDRTIDYFNVVLEDKK